MTESAHIVYFHGLPGSGRELTLFGAMHDQALADIFVPARGGDSVDKDLDSYMEAIAGQIETRFPRGAIHLIGFSLGAFIALQIAVRLRNRVEKIDLVSAAAPLKMGDFLDGMAGKSVFKTAQSSPFLFALLVKIQSWAARWTPGLLVKMVFASATGQDHELAAEPAFQKRMAAIIGQSLGQNACAYEREISFYVTDWADILDKVTQPVTLWHGEHDNWTPPAMADALQNALPKVAARHLLKGHSHYSTLRHFLQQDAKIKTSFP